VLRLLEQGRSTKKIAAELHLSTEPSGITFAASSALSASIRGARDRRRRPPHLTPDGVEGERGSEGRRRRRPSALLLRSGLPRAPGRDRRRRA
jgi:hypothetical protein